MAEFDAGQAAEIARQLRHHLASMRAGGVEFLPMPEEIRRKLSSPGHQPAPNSAPKVAEPPRTILFDDRAPPSRSSTETPADRRTELTVLRNEVALCTRCPELAATRTQTVFGTGPIDAEVGFVGDSPGPEDDREGEPFLGRAGKLFTDILGACGWTREDVYICNTIKCCPPAPKLAIAGNRPATPEEVANCREYLTRQLQLARPKFLVALGATAANILLDTTETINQLRGKIHYHRDTPVICTLHPLLLLSDDSKKRDCWEDMKFLLRTMGKPILPARRG